MTAARRAFGAERPIAAAAAPLHRHPGDAARDGRQPDQARDEEATMRTTLIACATALALVCGVGKPAPAQTYPTKPVTLVVPYAAGGTADVVSRVVAQELGPDRKSVV